ncbi:518_t:CDS:2, partial [Scutellospora calospora]
SSGLATVILEFKISMGLNCTLTNCMLQLEAKDNALSQVLSSQSESVIASSLSKHIRLSNQVLDDNETLNNYFAKPLNNNQQKKLNYLLLHATISCRFAFQWVEDSEIKALFKFVNPAIKLPRRSVLSGAEDISRTRSCWPDIIAKTKHLLSEIEQENIQINAMNLAHKIKEFDDNDLHDFPDDILSNLISPTCGFNDKFTLRNETNNLSKGYRINASRERFENYKEFECNEESNHEENNNFSESRTYCNVSSEEDTDIDINNKADDQVNSVDSWRCL